MDLTELFDGGGLGDAAIRERAEADGCLLLRGWIDPAPVLELGALVAMHALELGWIDGDGIGLVPTPAYTDSAFIELQRRCFVSPQLAAVRSDPGLNRLVALLLGDTFCAHRGDLVRMGGPGSPPTLPHQDAAYARHAANLWAMWMPLHPCPVAMGPIAVVPGSHRLGLLPHEGSPYPFVHNTDSMDWRAAEVGPGDVVAFSGRTLHGALLNETARARFSMDLRFEPAQDVPPEQRLGGW